MMEDFKRFMFKKQNTEKSGTSKETSSLFEGWNHLESFDDDTLGSNKGHLNDSLFLDDEDEDIPVIPDIEEIRDQEFIQKTADAPTVEINQLDNIDELNKKILKNNLFTNSGNVNLTILGSFCLPENKVRENDVSWTWDSLMTDVLYNEDIIQL